MKIIPIINEIEIDKVLEKLNLISNLTDWIQIDFSDGILTNLKHRFNSKDIEKIETDLNIEVHLMIENIEENIIDWLKLKSIKRVIIHLKTIKDIEKIFSLAKEFNKEIGIAIDLDINIEEVKKYFEKTNFFLFLGVEAGISGQKFNESILKKIQLLRKENPKAIIGVDGGINFETAKLVKEAGADIVYSSSYIFKSNDIKKAMNNILEI
jgi:ribulose-phosphate 3-epimerase